MVAEKQNALYVDLGYDLLRVPRDQIVRRTKGDDRSRARPLPRPGSRIDVRGSFPRGS